MTKDEILDALEDEREKFLEAIEGLPNEALEEPGVVGEWSVKDIIFHVSMWEAELVKLLWQAEQGGEPTSLLIADISIDETNTPWHEQSRTRSLDQVLEDFAGVRKQTQRRVRAILEKNFDDPGCYPWLGGSPLWKWIAEDSFGHEAEHVAQIKEWRERRGV